MNVSLTPIFQNLQDSDLSPSCHTNHPTVTGTSIIGLLCSDCVLIATDTLGSYGSLSRFTSISRIIEVGMISYLYIFDHALYQLTATLATACRPHLAPFMGQCISRQFLTCLQKLENFWRDFI